MHPKVELIIGLLFLIGLILISRNISEYVASVQVEEKEKFVILDAGHGGNDPGKVGVNNAEEKDINLAITKLVRDMLEEQEVEVLMTREMDEMLAESGSDNKKLEDMKARVSLINKNLPQLTVSIHQNSYTDASISGAQVFYYSGSEEGKKAAEIMQKALLALDEANTRQAKENDSYYLLKRTDVPTIIVECGFLSNPQEAELLVTAEYQKEVAQAVSDGILEYLQLK